jgi:hypothetical protein
VPVLAAVQARDEAGEADRVDLVDAPRAGVVAFLGRVARDREDVADALRMRAEERRLDSGDRHVARGEVGDRLHPAGSARGRAGCR